jgi:hypothetical protein
MNFYFFSSLINVALFLSYFIVLSFMVYKGFKKSKEAKKLKEVGVDVVEIDAEDPDNLDWIIRRNK